MIYDLNIAWTPSTPADALDRTLRQAAVLGYDVVALNHTISKLPIPSPITNPIPVLSCSSSSTTTNDRRLPTTVLRRATVHMSDPRDNHRLDAVAAAYDMLAVRPTTEAAFSHACVNLAEPSVISLDLASNLGYHLRPKPVMAAVRRGVRFEVCYSHAIAGSSSSSSSSSLDNGGAGNQNQNSNNRARALFVANLVGLVRASKGRGLVVSSGCPASRPMLLRAPADVVNLLAVWGLGAERGLEALSASPRGVVVNEGIRRSSFRGVVDIVQAAGGGGGGGDGAPSETTVVTGRKRQKQQQQQQQKQKQQQNGGRVGADGGETRKDPDDDAASAQDRDPQKGKYPKDDDNNNQQQQQQQQGVKRKNGEQAGAGDAADEAGQKLSKRQAKKQRRLVAQQAQAAGAAP